MMPSELENLRMLRYALRCYPFLSRYMVREAVEKLFRDAVKWDPSFADFQWPEEPFKEVTP